MVGGIQARGTAISFVRGSATSSRVQIDHVVALGDAWQSGAQQATAQQRQNLANDPMNLLAGNAWAIRMVDAKASV